METPKLDELLQRCCLTNELRVNAMLGTHGPALVAALKVQLELLKGCQFGFNTFLPDSKFIAREALSRIDPAIAHLEKLLTTLELEAACQK